MCEAKDMRVKYKVSASDKSQMFESWDDASNYAKLLLSMGYSEVILSISA